MSRRKLLMIVPAIPRATGGGLAMRAYQKLSAYATEYQVSLLVLDFGYCRQPIDDEVAQLISQMAYFDLSPFQDLNALLRSICFRLFPQTFFRLHNQPSEWRFINQHRLARIASAFDFDSFDLIDIHRLYLEPFARPLLKSSFNGLIQLDLDDIESETRMRIGELYQLNNLHRAAQLIKQDAARYLEMERSILPHFKRVLVCSEIDQKKLAQTYHARNIRVVPNTINILPADPLAPEKDYFTMLFVGTLSYYPNQDAINFFCHEVLPLIKVQTKRRLKIHIVGKSMPKWLLKRLQRIPEVVITGWIDDLHSTYQDADIVIAPLRAGGGTRIKILEALVHCRPVVTSTIGAEGLAVTDRKEVLIGDSAEAIAQKVLMLITDRQLAQTLSNNGYHLVTNNYHPEIVRRSLLLYQ